MLHTITTRNDLRAWVDDMTTGWWDRDAEAVDAITSRIQAMDHPQWGTDWSEFLFALPDLTELLPE